MKKEKPEKDAAYYKKLYIRTQIEFGILFIIFMIFIFQNFNIFMFKYLIGTKYVYVDDLNTIYKEELDIDTDQYFKYFDETAIQLFIDKIHETNNDEFTELYHIGEYSFIKKYMKEEAKLTNFEMLEDERNIGCLTISNFSTNARKNVFAVVDEMKNCDTLIIDLRNNTGGVVKDAKKLAELFLDKDMIIYSSQTRDNLKEYTSATEKEIAPKKIIILQNEYTASASEIFITALKENLDYVTVVGTTSYGKGIGQHEHLLMKQFGVKATAELFYTPKGNSINKTGIEPDYEYSESDIKEYVIENLCS